MAKCGNIYLELKTVKLLSLSEFIFGVSVNVSVILIPATVSSVDFTQNMNSLGVNTLPSS